MPHVPTLLLASLTFASLAAGYAVAAPADSASLRVTVRDSTGAVIVGATIDLQQDGAGLRHASTNGRGQALLDALPPGVYVLRVAAPGFADVVRSDLTLGAGARVLEVTLEIAGVSTEVTVERDPTESATDPRGGSMATVLSDAELDVLPDDEDDLQAMLSELAGPGAELQVDGLAETPLPPRAQIEEIRIRRNVFAADAHGGGRSRIEVVTRPGTDRWRSNVGFSLRDARFNARNAFAADQAPEQRLQGRASFQGPLIKDKTSVGLQVSTLWGHEAATILAATPDRLINDIVRQPRENIEASARLQHALTRAHSMRVEFGYRDNDSRNLGLGSYDLPERAYSERQTRQWLRASTTGALGHRARSTAGLQVRWNEAEVTPETRAPAIRVVDTLAFGGATQSGTRAERAVVAEEKVETSWRSHTVSAGAQLEWLHAETTEVRNANGTFTFASLADFAAGRPTTFTLWRGDPSVAFTMFRGAWFLQDDIRVRKNLTVGLGLRHEWQSQLPDRWNLAPRVSATWAPHRDGRTTIRGGFGVFHDWYEASTYEETLQLDGTRGSEVSVLSPGFPDPFAGADQQVLPPSVVRQAANLELPLVRHAALAVERRLLRDLRIGLSYTGLWGTHALRGRNVNLPSPDGSRPQPAIGNLIEIRSVGRSREQELQATVSGRLPWRGLFVSMRYEFEHERNDGDGPLSLPANHAAPDEWGPASGDVRHELSLFWTIDLVKDLQLTTTLRAESAPPYTITTGHDDNGDTVFNDRPAGVGRNSARGEGWSELNMRLAWRIRVGMPSSTGGGEGGRGRRGEQRRDGRVVSELFVNASNLLNTVSQTGFRGALTSRFFGQPTSARAPRRLELGARVTF